MNGSHFSLTCPPGRFSAIKQPKDDDWVLIDEQIPVVTPSVPKPQPSLTELHYRAMEENRLMLPVPPKVQGAIAGYGGFIPNKAKVIGVSFERVKDLASKI